MKTKFVCLFVLIFLLKLVAAQHWNSYSPTAGFDINAVDILKPGNIITGGGRESNPAFQIMFSSPDYGLTWYENQHDGLAAWNKSLAFADTLNGYGVGDWGRIIKTDDGGLNWGYAVFPINRTLNKIVNVTPLMYYAVGGTEANDSMQTILKTTDGGANWNVIYDTQGPWLKSVYFITTLKGYAVGDSGVILATTNGGGLWSSVTSPVQRDFNAITFLNADTGYIVGGTKTGTSRRTILRTTDGGTNWSILTDYTGGVFNDISFANDTIGYIVGDSAVVLKTTDAGQTWMPEQVSNAMTGNEELRSVNFYDKNFGVIGGKGGVLYVYTNIVLPEVYTTGSNLIDSTHASLNANIKTFGFPVLYSFNYSIDSNLTGYSSTIQQYFTSDSLTPVTQQVSGLSPGTRYYYFVAVQTFSGMVYGDTLSFITYTPHYSAQTDSANSITYNGAVMFGRVNKFYSVVNPYFIVSKNHDLTFGLTVPTIPATITDSLMHLVTATTSALSPNNTYYYTLAVQAPYGIVTGDTLSFTTTVPNFTFLTENASSITPTSAQLNGFVEHLIQPTYMKFEYGTTLALGDTVIANPNYVLDSQQHFVSAPLTALQPNTTYYYWLNGTAAYGSMFGNMFSFSTPPFYTLLNTLPATLVTSNTAQLNGEVSGLTLNSYIIFEYGTTIAFGDTIVNISGVITDTLYHHTTATLTGLIPNSLYYFRMKIKTDAGIFFSDTSSFFTGAPYSEFTTNPAQNVTLHSAQLNGVVNKFLFPVNMYFQFGTTPAISSQVVSNPSFINDTLQHNISATALPLQTNAIYYFSMKGISSAGTYNGDTLIFYTGNPYTDLRTLSAAYITDSTAQLNGIVDKLLFQANVSFEYGTSTTLGNEKPSLPSMINDTALHYISMALDSLLPATLYYFRLKVRTSVGTYYGNLMALMTSGPPLVQTLSASNITTTSAVLNGTITHFPYTATIKFEYGTSPVMGNEILANPGIVSDTNYHFISAPINGLQNNALYYYRIKALIDTGAETWGDVKQFYTGNPIPNWDFEIWDTTYIERPKQWISGGFVRKVPSVFLGSAIEIRTDTSVFSPHLSAIMQGVIGDAFVGGAPFTEKPDSLNGYFKYNVATGDTATIFVILKKSGALICVNRFNITGSTGSNFLPLSFPITYFPNVAPDSIILGFFSSQFSNHLANMSDRLAIDNISFSGTTQNVPDPGFEDWAFLPVENAQSWMVSDYPALVIYGPGTKKIYTKTTDSYTGNFAMEIDIQREYSHTSIDIGAVKLIDTVAAFPLQSKPSQLNGYYKYNFGAGAEDSFEVEIRVFYQGNIVGEGSFISHGVAQQYSSFAAPINYQPNFNFIPDGASLIIHSSLNPYAHNTQLIIDALGFDGFTTDVNNDNIGVGSNNESEITIYPNPSNDNLTIESGKLFDKKLLIQLFDLDGRVIKEIITDDNTSKLQINIAEINAGYYLIQMKSEYKTFNRKIVILK